MVRWLLVFWLFVLSAVSFLDRTNISIAGSSLATDYGLSNQQLGFVFSAFLIGYALFQTPGGCLADKIGSRRVLTAAVLWWGVFTALVAVLKSTAAHALFFFIAIRFLLGAGEAIIYPASNQFVTRWIPTHQRGIANGWIFAGVGAGAGISPPLITWVMVHYGWRSSFYICAAIGLAAGAVWYLIARDRGIVKTFRVQRVARARMLERRFVRPSTFDAGEYWKGVASHVAREEEPFIATFHMTRRGLANAALYFKIDSQTRVRNKLRAEWIVRIRFPVFEAAFHEAISWHEDGIALEPPELCRRIHEHANALATLYADRTTAPSSA